MSDVYKSYVFKHVCVPGWRNMADMDYGAQTVARVPLTEE